MPNAVVTFNGRITLPAPVIKRLGLKTGDNIEFIENDKGQFVVSTGARQFSGPEAWVPKPRFERALEELDEVRF
jgi:AbrB family looped-hinge helix DNA binding protein